MMMPRLTGAGWSAVGFALMMFLAARTSGAGWLIVMCCLLIGALVAGAVWSGLSLVRVGVAVTAPADTVAGEETPLSVTARRTGLGFVARILDPPGQPAGVVSGPNDLGPVVFTRRGLVRSLRIELVSSAPFGLVRQRRVTSVPLTQPVHVAPRIADGAAHDDVRGAEDGEVSAGAPIHGDRLRSVREHVSGDPMRMVHWPATARRGTLVVKELESPTQPRLHVVLTLIGVVELDDAAAERAMGVVARALDDDRAVTLYTVDDDGPHVTSVRALQDAGRRLAVAGPGQPPVPAAPEGRALHVRSGRT